MIDLFRPTYADARATWLALAAARGLVVDSHIHPQRGPQGEVLAMDVVRDGPADAECLLLTTSAVHGIEGQHSHPQGLYFGGLHSGLGPFGVGERIFASMDGGAALTRARQWWGEGVTSVHTGSSTSIPMTGPIQMALDADCPGPEYTGICLEFGTVPLPQMILALRADHWLYQHAQADAALASSVRAQLRAAFYPDTDAWKQALWQQGLQATQQALAGLAH